MRRIVIAAILAAMLVVGVVGYALGSIPSSDGRIHACYSPGSPTTPHKLWWVLDDDVGNCPTGTQHISWAAD
jgi:hypothetical protein